MQAEETPDQDISFTEKYYIGISHYRTIFTQLETIRQLTFILAFVIALLQEAIGLAMVIISWNSSALELQLVAISYLFLLLVVMVGFPAFFVQGSSWGQTDTPFNEIPIIAALYYIIGPQSSELQTHSGILYYTLFVLLIFTGAIVYWPIVLACVYLLAVITCIPCVFRDYFLARMNRAHRGASNREINRFPTFVAKLDKVEEKEPEKVGFLFRLFKKPKKTVELVVDNEHNQCCICISEYENDQVLRQLSCSHYFHQSCIDEWLSINATCPLCVVHV
ncbi:hypothetical protein HDV01_003992 [Terramyces sp. JEL0728]|nr:hypothetical protein HDV01_003992 [Terramyces sp. JEL0728]